MGRPRTLSTNMLLVVVFLAIAAALVSGTATTVLLRNYQGGQLNQDVRESVQRALHVAPNGGGAPGVRDARGQGSQTLTAYLLANSTLENGEVLGSDTDQAPLSARDLAVLRAHTSSGPAVITLSLPDAGRYRVATAKISTSDGTLYVVSGLPTKDLDQMTRKLILWTILITLAVALLSALAGRLIISRQLRGLRTVAAVAHDVSELPLDSGEIEGIAGVPADLADGITEVGQVGEAFNKMLSHVEDALNVRTASEQRARQFIADASHEIRTPLAVIRGFADLADRVPVGEEDALRSSIDRIKGSALELSTLVEDMMSLTRLDAAGPAVIGDFDVSELAANAQEAIALLHPEHTWAIDVPDEPVQVLGDELGMRRVITNLLSNAGAHTPVGSHVVLAVHPTPTTVRISVSDNGPGIPAELQARVFDRFVRADQARTSGNGSGLGLAIVKAIVEKNDGTVTVASDGSGTVITAEIPVNASVGGPAPA
ncbi:MAG: hypothetical protein JWP74_4122 [Marmoricola sp.]|nr:hypothetical protein [Marmoricola sp.]